MPIENGTNVTVELAPWDAKAFLKALFRRKWILLSSYLVAGLVVGITLHMPLLYKADATLLLELGDGSRLDQYSQDRILQTAIALPKSRSLIEKVVQAYLWTGTSPAEEDASFQRKVKTLTARVRVSPEGQSSIIKLEVSDEDSRRCAGMANFLAKTFIEQGYAVKEGAVFRVVSPAVVPSSPDYLFRMTVLLFEVAFGVIGGMALVLLVDYSDKSLRDRGDTERYLQLPVLATLPDCRKYPASCKEYLLRLACRIEILRSASFRKVLIVTGAKPGEGATFLVHRLARIMAGMDKNVRIVVVDANLRNPSMHELLGLKRSPGLADLYRENKLPLDQVLQPSELQNLFFLAAGEDASTVIDRMASGKTADILSELKSSFDLVLLDSSATATYGETASLSNQADGVLFVVLSSGTHREIVRQGAIDLRESGSKMLGVVMNRQDMPIPQILYDML
jgi:Mrp family chromosome partitioning ATPase/capsular polysaccharide biosynthesis protein